MNLRALVVVSVIACGGKADEPAPAGSASAPSAPAGITVPVVTGPASSIAGYLALAIVDDGVRVLGPIASGDAAHPALAGVSLDVDDHGQLLHALPAGDPATVAKLHDANVSPDRTVVFADVKRAAASLDGVHAIGPSCTNLAVANAGRLSLLPICFPRAMAGSIDERPDLYAQIKPDLTSVLVTHGNEPHVAHDAAELDKVLAEHKASTEFHDRTDAAILVAPDVTIGRLAEVIAALRKAGFVDVRWAIEPQAPVPIPDSQHRAPSEHPAGILARPSEVQVTVDCQRVDGAAVEDGARVVKSRTGLFRACFQKELAHGAHDGDADVSFGVASGIVTSVTIAGNVPSPAVAACTKAQIQRMRFPPAIRAVRCAFTYKHQ